MNASTPMVWSVLTDYDRIPKFVASMRASRVREILADGSLIVEQKAVGRMFFLSKTMRLVLDVRRTPGSLRFTDTGHQDFQVYDGDWEVRPITAGTSVTYHLLVEPRFSMPSFFAGRAMKRGAQRLLEQVRAEIVRREGAR
ncbi:MAG: SRPBCC family protein [Elusimicrobiota bacterium]